MITVLGASGYIGSHIVAHLNKIGLSYYAPNRNEDLTLRDLGDVIYCIGLTADFRTKPFETVEAHVCLLKKILQNAQFDSLTYLSSTRVYINITAPKACEEDKILVDPMQADDLYTLSKLTGECLCLSSGKNVKIVRLSNIYGGNDKSSNFLSDIVTKIKNDRHLKLLLGLNSSKDYLYIEDAIDMLLKIALKGSQKIYNVASGINTSNTEIIEELKKHVTFSEDINKEGKNIIFPKIAIDKIKTEFNFTPQGINQTFKHFF